MVISEPVLIAGAVVLLLAAGAWADAAVPLVSLMWLAPIVVGIIVCTIVAFANADDDTEQDAREVASHVKAMLDGPATIDGKLRHRQSVSATGARRVHS